MGIVCSAAAQHGLKIQVQLCPSSVAKLLWKSAFKSVFFVKVCAVYHEKYSCLHLLHSVLVSARHVTCKTKILKQING